MMKLSDYVSEFISNLNVRHVFLLPGGGCMHLVDSFGKNRKINPICTLHEQAGVIAAEAYSQYTGNIGVFLATTGPGGLNTITGVVGAWIDSTPMIILSGQVKKTDLKGDSGVRQMGVQETDNVGIVKSITKYAITIVDPQTVKYHLEKALFLAKSGRPGPVWLEFPLDVQGAMIDESKLSSFVPEKINAMDDLSDPVKNIIELLNQSERPVILVGNGVRHALPEFLEFIEILQIPVLTTWKALDFVPENHPLYFGRPGAIASRGANFIQQNSDLIITLGARLDFPQTAHNHENFARHAKKVIVDIDPSEIKKLKMKIDIPIIIDSKLFLREFFKQQSKLKKVERMDWINRCNNWKKKYPVILPEYRKNNGLVNSYYLIDVLSEVLTESDLLVPGSSGACAEVTLQSFRVKRGQRVQNTPGLGSMGFGLPASIGACLASGGRRTISIIGDGGLQHNIQELETLARLNLPIKIFILNNNGYGSIRATQNRFFEGRLVCTDPSSGLTIPDTCKIAEAYGLKNVKIKTQTNLTAEVKIVLETDGPVICEVLVEPDIITAPRVSSEVRTDGTIVSKPMEDLWPFLDRKEFNENMMIAPIT